MIAAMTMRTRAELREFLALAESIPISRKLLAVEEILERFPGQFLIFTEFRQHPRLDCDPDWRPRASPPSASTAA